ncbi:hypothetical protein BHE74_00003455 [Ensete ventricosum]|nr:hypothetical protein BHE74_00003455 [Ensete ventricosum]
MTMNLKEGSRCVVNYGEDLTTVDFDDDVSLAEKEQTILLEPSSTFRLDQTIMPPQDQAPMKYADLEPMPMNLKEGNRYVVNHDECLMVVDFSGYVSLAEKRLQDSRGGSQQHDCRRLRMAWMADDGCREERNRGGRRLEDCRGKQGSRGGQHTVNGRLAGGDGKQVEGSGSRYRRKPWSGRDRGGKCDQAARGLAPTAMAEGGSRAEGWETAAAGRG